MYWGPWISLEYDTKGKNQLLLPDIRNTTFDNLQGTFIEVFFVADMCPEAKAGQHMLL